jgi:serine/threonine protein kinase
VRGADGHLISRSSALQTEIRRIECCVFLGGRAGSCIIGRVFPTEPVPERIGAYKVLRRVAGTGSADVYVGRMDGPMGFQRLCTLKLVPNTIEGDARFAEELAREASICARLNHPAVVRMFDFFEHERHLVLVLEHVDGVSLERLMQHLGRRRQKLGDAAIAAVGREVAGALAHAHAARDEDDKPAPVIHRNLHPDNVLIGWDGQVRLTGFGLGKILGRTPDTVVGVVKGAPGYMAPEQLRGERVTPRTDAYGLALMLWALFTARRPPPEGTRPAKLALLRTDLPRQVTAAIDGALEIQPDKRTSTCGDIARALASIPGIDAGRDELREKALGLRGRTKVSDTEMRAARSSAPRRRVSLQGVRPGKPPASSKARLSMPPSRPPGMTSRPPPPPGGILEEGPRSVVPFLRALADKASQTSLLAQKAQQETPVEVEDPGPSAQRPRDLEAKRKTPPPPPIRPPKLSVAAPIGIEQPKDWEESVPDEDALERLFDEATSRRPTEEVLGGLATGGVKPPSTRPKVVARGSEAPKAGEVRPKVASPMRPILPPPPALGGGKPAPAPGKPAEGAKTDLGARPAKATDKPPAPTTSAAAKAPEKPATKPPTKPPEDAAEKVVLKAPERPADRAPDKPAAPAAVPRFEVPATIVTPSPPAPAFAPPAFAPPPAPPLATPAAPALPPPTATPAVRFGPPPMPTPLSPGVTPPAPPLGLTPPAPPLGTPRPGGVLPAPIPHRISQIPLPPPDAGPTPGPWHAGGLAAARPERGRPSTRSLILAGGAAGLAAAGIVLAILQRGSSGAGAGAESTPTATAQASTSAAHGAPPSASEEVPAASSAPSSEASAGGPPPGYGYLTVEFPSEGNVYVSGKRLGPTNQRLQIQCGRWFIRVASTAEGRYPEWLSPGTTVQVPCQDATRVAMQPGKAPPEPKRPRTKPRR